MFILRWSFNTYCYINILFWPLLTHQNLPGEPLHDDWRSLKLHSPPLFDVYFCVDSLKSCNKSWICLLIFVCSFFGLGEQQQWFSGWDVRPRTHQHCDKHAQYSAVFCAANGSVEEGSWTGPEYITFNRDGDQRPIRSIWGTQSHLQQQRRLRKAQKEEEKEQEQKGCRWAGVDGEH